ncbi:MAG TPA: inner membrane CreD family protein [Thermoanaerobaculia bacterium]|jgi:inner membrane protein involved in colicin E2 resistance
MLGRYVLALIAIFLCTTLAWIVLGASIFARTHDAGNGLGPAVESAWGAPQEQTPPCATTSRTVQKTVDDPQTNTKKIVNEEITTTLPVERSRVRVAFDLDQRQKGLLWFATYRVDFRGDYVVRNTTPSDEVTINIVFPAPEAIYDDLVLRVDGQPVPTTVGKGCVTAVVHRPPGTAIRVETGYKSQGLSTWKYSFGKDVSQIHDFVLEMQTNFRAIDFPQGSLSPTVKKPTPTGWLLTWKYANVVSGYGIGMVMPEKLQPGPLAGRISMFAPVSLLFFFFFMFVIATLRKIELHPMHYFFLATSFFAFHLLLAYLVDHVSIHAAFLICSAVSIFLVVSYLRVVVNARFAWREAALSQFVYLVLFSYAFFFKGFTGLAITIGAIVSLFAAMQMTARVPWGRDNHAA